MNDFFAFRRMLMPIFIHFFFWIGGLACVFVGIYDMIYQDGIWVGLQILVLGPIFIRVGCEFLILFFRINETLTEIKDGISKLG